MTILPTKLHLPQLKRVTHRFLLKDCVVIAAAGFEDRTLALSKNINTLRSHLILAVYKDWEPGNRIDAVVDSYRVAGIDSNAVTFLNYDRFNPDAFGQELQTSINEAAQTRVLVDISTMSRLEIMIVLDVCRSSNREISIFYAEAANYGPTEEEYEEARQGLYPRPSIQVYSGLGGLVRSARLSSVALQGEPTAVIAFMSMNEVLTQALINCISPSRLFLINGRPPSHTWREHATAWIHDELRSEWPLSDNPILASPVGDGLPSRATSTLRYAETVHLFLDLYWNCASEYRIVLAPTGSKMQTVASFIVKAIHRDIHVEYPTPESFLKSYSQGIGQQWWVDFGKLEDSVQEWRSTVMRDRLMIIV